MGFIVRKPKCTTCCKLDMTIIAVKTKPFTVLFTFSVHLLRCFIDAYELFSPL